MELKIKNFRITNINKFTGFSGGEGNKSICKTLSDKDGLAIDFSIDNCESYFVLSFVKPDKDGGIYVENVGLRPFEYIDEENYSTYKTLIYIAKDAVRLANMED